MKNFLVIAAACFILWWFFWYEPKKPDMETDTDNDANNDTHELKLQPKTKSRKDIAVCRPIFDNIPKPTDAFVYFLNELNSDLCAQKTSLKHAYRPSNFLLKEFAIKTIFEVQDLFKPPKNFDWNKYARQFPFDFYIAGYAVFNNVGSIEIAENIGVFLNDSSNCEANVFIPLYMFEEFVNLGVVESLEIYLNE
ncbi:MAG: hypothetical protein FWF72_02200 [Paludibacter sp.]|nr:hypothetical protein [Paludibacter sp.]